jgi:hypothetical protein
MAHIVHPWLCTQHLNAHTTVETNTTPNDWLQRRLCMHYIGMGAIQVPFGWSRARNWTLGLLTTQVSILRDSWYTLLCRVVDPVNTIAVI